MFNLQVAIESKSADVVNTATLAQKGFLLICAHTRRVLSLVYNNPQWRIQGRDPGGPGHPLFLDQTETRRAEKIFLRPGPPPPLLSQGRDDRPPLPHLKVWVRH